MQIDSAILYDAVFLLHKAMETLNSRNIDNTHEESIMIDPVPLSCDENQKYQAGPNIMSLMREVNSITSFSLLLYRENMLGLSLFKI